MEYEKSDSFSKSFSLYEIAKPRFTPNQIRVKNDVQTEDVGLPKPLHKLSVKKSGKIVLS